MNERDRLIKQYLGEIILCVSPEEIRDTLKSFADEIEKLTLCPLPGQTPDPEPDESD
jgi:hypothetical protein